MSASDRPKLDEYLTSVREVEKRVERMRGAKDQADDRAKHRGQPALSMKRPDNGLPEDIREHMRLMWTSWRWPSRPTRPGSPRVLMCRDLSGLFYPFLDVRDAHHPASHRI